MSQERINPIPGSQNNGAVQSPVTTQDYNHGVPIPFPTLLMGRRSIHGLASTSRITSPQKVETCQGDGPFLLSKAFVIREDGGKTIRDVYVDTHDLINEPGGFIMNLSRHGGGVGESDFRIHLGIRQKWLIPDFPQQSCPPGTLTLTDDYAREIFRGIVARPQLENLSAVLEINDKIDPYELKRLPDVSPQFLVQFMPTFPTTISKFQVEMPGVSAAYLPEWKYFMDMQLTLKVLQCNFGVVMWDFYAESVANNAKTLERVILRRLQTYDISTGKYNSMNWEIFQDCEKLAYLKVTCGFRTRTDVYLPVPPPTTVFLHENLDKLPEESLEELHLGKIWVDPCLIQDFQKKRPHTLLCLNCNDKEYYDGDLPQMIENGKLVRANALLGVRVVTMSSLDVNANFNCNGGGGGDPESRVRNTDDRQLATIVLAMFQVILVALTILFIVIYFGHWRGKNSLIGNRSTTNSSVECCFETVVVHHDDLDDHDEHDNSTGHE